MKKLKITNLKLDKVYYMPNLEGVDRYKLSKFNNVFIMFNESDSDINISAKSFKDLAEIYDGTIFFKTEEDAIKSRIIEKIGNETMAIKCLEERQKNDKAAIKEFKRNLKILEKKLLAIDKVN